MAGEVDPIDETELTDDDRELRVTQLKIRRRKPGTRLDKYLRGRFPRMSRTVLQRLIKGGGITVNGLPTKASYEPDAGDLVEVILPPPIPTDVIPEDIPLEILYEDDFMLAINKPAGIICHPARFTQTGTIVNALAHHANSLSKGGDPFRPGIVHRLDKNTTGVMLVAKTDEAHWRLSLQFERRTIQKTYLAIVEGVPHLDGDIVDQPLAGHPVIKDRYMVANRPLNDMITKEAVTRFEVMERFSGFALMGLHPKTGRTHQLRVHMSSIGHPILGDTLYGGHLVSERDISGSGSSEPLYDHQCLHAYRIEFTHPIREHSQTLEAPLSAKLQSVIDLLRTHRPLGKRRP